MTSEAVLKQWLKRFVQTHSRSYDPKFAQWAKSVGYVFNDSEASKTLVLDFFRKHKRAPSQREDNPEEFRIAGLMRNFILASSRSYDPDFLKTVTALGYVSRVENSKRKKVEIFAFFKKHGRWPKQKSKNLVERRLGNLMSGYVSKVNCSYDAVFTMEARQKGWLPKEEDVATIRSARKSEIWKFYKKEGRWPRLPRADIPQQERTLGRLMKRYTGSRFAAYDASFDAKVRSLGYGKKGRK